MYTLFSMTDVSIVSFALKHTTYLPYKRYSYKYTYVMTYCYKTEIKVIFLLM